MRGNKLQLDSGDVWRRQPGRSWSTAALVATVPNSFMLYPGLQIRFFGKFFGLYNDYYVFETTLKAAPEIPAAPGACFSRLQLS